MRLATLLDWPPVWLLACLALVAVIDRIAPLPLFGPAGAALGGALIGVGLGLMFAAVLRMAARRTTIVPRRDPAALVTDGIFRISRNPIYLGDALVLAGAILWWDVPLALPLLPAFVWTIQHRFILGEEARLQAAFGPAYAAYCARTRRWI